MLEHRTRRGSTPLYVACVKGNTAAAAALLRLRADPTLPVPAPVLLLQKLHNSLHRPRKCICSLQRCILWAHELWRGVCACVRVCNGL